MSRDDEQDFVTVVEHEQALKVYIDALLLEPPADDAASVETAAPTPLVAPVAAEPDAATVAIDAVEPPPQPRRRQAPAVDRDAPFECLLFKVAGGLRLAVPLVRLTGILKWEGHLTPIPGYADWFLGLMSKRGRQVKVIDIAAFVIPENHNARQALADTRRYQHLLLIDDGKIGLACDDLGRVLKLSADKVRWRKDAGSRPWLAGTVIEQMSALLDVEQLTAMLKEGAALDDIHEDTREPVDLSDVRHPSRPDDI